MDWLAEKESLTRTVRCLKEKIKHYERTEDKFQQQIQELQEAAEVAEFRILELEGTNEKVGNNTDAYKWMCL